MHRGGLMVLGHVYDPGAIREAVSRMDRGRLFYKT